MFYQLTIYKTNICQLNSQKQAPVKKVLLANLGCKKIHTFFDSASQLNQYEII